VTVEMAVKNDGTILGVKASMILDGGAYAVPPLNPAGFTVLVHYILPGPYRIRNYAFEGMTVTTNKAPYIAYRGPWAVESWAREGMLDVVARELKLDPVAVRLKNMLTPEEQPFTMATGLTLDRVSARETLQRALELAHLEQFRAEQKQARKQGRVLGFGLATFIEPAPGGRDVFPIMSGARKEMASVRVEPTGQVTVITAQIPHGQSHETTLAQVVATELGVPFENVRVLHGDTQSAPFSMIGTGGSQAATYASGAALYATREVKKQIFQVASGLLEVSADDLELVNGVISVRGVPQKALPLAQIASAVYMAPGQMPAGSPAELLGTSAYDGGEGGFLKPRIAAGSRSIPAPAKSRSRAIW
jgi:carbon-monoxide dehydrogenase large subunit